MRIENSPHCLEVSTFDPASKPKYCEQVDTPKASEQLFRPLEHKLDRGPWNESFYDGDGNWWGVTHDKLSIENV